MNPEIFAEWLRRQGHKVYQTASSYWYEAGPRVFQAFPYHWLITPSGEEIRGLMVSRGIIALRYSTPFDSPAGKVSYHIVLRSPYNMDTLKAQARNGVKRGLNRCGVERIPFERLATEGWNLQQDTLDRQNRLRSMTQAEWERICRSAADLPGFEAWAAISDSNLAAALIACQIEKIWCVPYALCHRKYLQDHANNALFYSVSCNLLARDDTEEIFFTVQSLDAPPSVDDFKIRMGLIPMAVRQRVDFHPWLEPLAGKPTHKLFSRLLQRDEGHPVIAKAEGMLRFHIEGKQPLMQQQWPECLAQYRQELLNTAEGGAMDDLERCQLPGLPRMAEGRAVGTPLPIIQRIKRSLAVPWNYYVKRGLKNIHRVFARSRGVPTDKSRAAVAEEFHIGEVVKVRSWEEIRATLDPFKELKGCAFLPDMNQYCGTTQRVLQVMQRFLDERDYKVKKVNGVVLLENVICRGTPVFGRCDRCCHLFWRAEWLEKVG